MQYCRLISCRPPRFWRGRQQASASALTNCFQSTESTWAEMHLQTRYCSHLIIPKVWTTYGNRTIWNGLARGSLHFAIDIVRCPHGLAHADNEKEDLHFEGVRQYWKEPHHLNPLFNHMKKYNVSMCPFPNIILIARTNYHASENKFVLLSNY